MIVLVPPKNPPYDYPSLAYYLSVWRNFEAGAPWIDNGHAPCVSVFKNSVTSRQWDASSSVMDDELEKSTANIIGECMDALDAVERCVIMYGNCGVYSRWVHDMEPERAQARYEAALLRLSTLARKAGVAV
jgi:hypothetical protein